MPKRPFQRNKQENRIIRNLDDVKLYDTLMPAIRACMLAGGGADAILKKAESLAVLKIVELIGSEKDDVALKASVEVANRSLGKPVERTLNIYGDISRMNERDIDNQILKAIEKSGATQLIDAVITERKTLPVKIKQTRKPRKSDPLGQDQSQKPTEGS